MGKRKKERRHPIKFPVPAEYFNLHEIPTTAQTQTTHQYTATCVMFFII